MAKSESRKCKKCKRICFKLIPEESPYDFLFKSVRPKKVREWRYIREESGFYNVYCMDCIKVLFPDQAK